VEVNGLVLEGTLFGKGRANVEKEEETRGDGGEGEGGIVCRSSLEHA